MYSIKVDNHYLAWKFWIADLGLRNQVRTFLIHLLFNILYKKTRHKAWDRFSFFFFPVSLLFIPFIAIFI